MIDKVELDGTIYGVIIHCNFYSSGIEFFTPNEFSQQVGYMNRPAGYVIPPHVHRVVKREVLETKETLYIKSGKLRVDFYTDQKEYFTSRVLHTGDVILLASGGHGFEIMEDAQIIEIKQGPYAGDLDKERFDIPNSIKLNYGA